jgi:hypothetical protein
LDQISQRLPPGSFVVVDHWEADPFAIGLARPSEHDYLVYITSDRDVHGRWFLSRELPRKHDVELYHEAGSDQFADIDALSNAIAEHLGAA